MARKISVGRVVRDVDAVVEYLAGLALVDAWRFAIRRKVRGIEEVTFEGAQEISVAIRDLPYAEIYHVLLKHSAFNIRMLDGGLLQMGYYFKDRRPWKHRLAFFPSPMYRSLQDDTDAYLRDDRYLDSAPRNTVPIPVRFDFSAERVESGWPHPNSHLSLGQFENCRIPVSAPVPPLVFADFVLRNFYSISIAEGLPKDGIFFDRTILPAEAEILHLMVPSKR